MESNAAFWNERVKKYGHTGWTDQATYYYDQYIRLNTIENLIQRHAVNLESALDYGCGTGDFANMMSSYFQHVTAVDISELVIHKALAKHQADNISFGLVSDDTFQNRYDLILSVTVLQHVTEDVDLQELLNQFYKSLQSGGRLIILESFRMSHQESPDYLKFREIESVKSMLNKAGFDLLETLNFYHPSEAATPTYRNYRNKLTIKGLRVLSHFNVPLSKPILSRIAKEHATKDVGIVNQESMTKILIMKKN